jgi:hypothetical protein
MKAGRLRRLYADRGFEYVVWEAAVLHIHDFVRGCVIYLYRSASDAAKRPPPGRVLCTGV